MQDDKIIHHSKLIINLEKVTQSITKEDMLRDLALLEEDLKNTIDKTRRGFIKEHIQSKKEDIKNFT